MAVFLAPLVMWLGTFVLGLGGFFTGVITVLVAWFLVFAVGLLVLALDGVTGIVSWLVSSLYSGVVFLLVRAADTAIGLLPAASEQVAPAINFGVVYSWFGWANHYIPLTEAAALWVLYMAFLGGLYMYKAVKLLCGGG
jgi:hypothetical protein